jgi:hypothetical protein
MHIKSPFIDYTFLSALVLLIPLWSIPGTIALRYFCVAILCFVIFYSKLDYGSILKNTRLLLLMYAYLLIQLVFFSSNYNEAFHNFKSEWLKFIIFSLLGLGCGNFLVKLRLIRLTLYLGILWTVPLLIHLCLSLIKWIELGHIPIQYAGLSISHGDLAYSSIHATIFLSIFFLFQAKSLFDKAFTHILFLLILLSLLIAGSRGGVIFVFISLFLVSLITFTASKLPLFIKKRTIMLLSSLCLLSFGVYAIAQYSDPIRWNSTWEKISAGFKVNAWQISCQGIASYENSLGQNGVDLTPSEKEMIQSLKSVDGSRVIALFTAINLIPQNILGINQSKLAYFTALEKACPETKPLLLNAHNGWLDTALGIGLIGALFYLMVLINFFYKGIKACQISNLDLLPYSVGLSVCSFVWILRSLIDSAQRDQMLEMQIFVICLFYGFINKAGVKSMNRY